MVAQQAAGLAVHGLVTGVEDALQAAARSGLSTRASEWIGERRPRVLRRSIMRCNCGAQSCSGKKASW
jgi:hypothetical protein